MRRYAQDLKEYADLRNAIVHERAGGYVIPEPNDRAVKDIEQIATLVTSPPVVTPLFARKVLALTKTDPVARAVQLMLEPSISQFPVYDRPAFAGLLTTNTIARWLGSHIRDDVFRLSGSSIGNVLAYTEHRDTFRFVARNAPIFDVIELFSSFERKGHQLDAVLISEHGRPTERLISIMTIFDLPMALNAVNKRST